MYTKYCALGVFFGGRVGTHNITKVRQFSIRYCCGGGGGGHRQLSLGAKLSIWKNHQYKHLLMRINE